LNKSEKIGPPESPEKPAKRHELPHPFADTSHIDEPEFTMKTLTTLWLLSKATIRMH